MIVECPGCRSRYDLGGRPPGTQARCRCGTSFRLPEPSRAAGSLGCPGCGAAVEPGAARCGFCQTALLVQVCPRCFARGFHGARHCSGCGAEVALPARVGPDGEASLRRCPRCTGAPLDAALVGDVCLDECAGCGGVWLDADAFERVLAGRRGASADALLGRAIAARAAPAPTTGAVSYVKCPDCGEVMNRINFARRSGVIVDVCRAHGTWFDADELPRVLAFAREGGIEQSQRREAEELIQEARRATAAAAGARAAAPFAADLAPSFGTRRADAVGSLLGVVVGILVDG